VKQTGTRIMQEETKTEALKRLNYIRGHLDGVRRMIEEDKYCVDVLKQTYAIRRAIENLESLMLEGHLNTCVVEGIQADRSDEVVKELVELYALKNK
jgi:CsoR family transcriptional regulator, copper-sensing transcriptional repressor